MPQSLVVKLLPAALFEHIEANPHTLGVQALSHRTAGDIVRGPHPQVAIGGRGLSRIVFDTHGEVVQEGLLAERIPGPGARQKRGVVSSITTFFVPSPEA